MESSLLQCLLLLALPLRLPGTNSAGYPPAHVWTVVKATMAGGVAKLAQELQKPSNTSQEDALEAVQEQFSQSPPLP